jgi:pyruvate/2-oxoglutarate dehydrogenase complex dihydrolipoamide dehydrogenase (E3) component
MVSAMQPDAVIVAIGADPIRLQVPGADGSNVILAKDMFDADVTLGKRVAIIGGGLVGCEAALQLTHDGYEVTVIEMLDSVASDAMMEHKAMLLERLNKEATVLTGARCEAIDQEGVTVNVGGKSQKIPADTVIMSVGYRANADQAAEFLDTCDFTRRIGDCNTPGKIGPAIRYGYFAAMDV